ncbi:MAG: hypothetical protein JJ921_18965 [Pseudomonadales bacterium]|nr:hypothetical protein [Pseudomonadales bacterium]MBO7007957.1 hypothetical protein [Pseudomonadales bacterium]
MPEFDEKNLQSAFRNSKYTWRTLRNVSKETGFDQDQIEDYIKSHGDIFVQSSVDSNKGEKLFGLREAVREKSSLGSRFSSAFKNRSS